MLMTFFGWKHKNRTPPYNLFQERDTNICSFVAVVQSLLNINQTNIVVLVLEKINSSEESWSRLFIICHANYREHYERKVLFVVYTRMFIVVDPSNQKSSCEYFMTCACILTAYRAWIYLYLYHWYTFP